MSNSFHLHDVYHGYNHRKNLIDIQLPDNYSGQLVVFIHGFMGYMDWGCWQLMQAHFLKSGYGFVRYNVSHNGTTPEYPNRFVDLDAFSINSYSAELFDLHQVIQFVQQQKIEIEALHLIGHSRGGGIALLAGSHPSVASVTTLAAISNIEKRFPQGEELEKWRTEEKRYILNSRTQQNMPLCYEQYTDFLAHRDQLSIEKACGQLHKPVCLIHGDNDSSVPIEEGEELSKWLSSKLHVIVGADHTFGSREPWESSKLPAHLSTACAIILQFLDSLKK